MKIQIDVTNSDINHGVGCDASDCMVTRAVMRHVRPEVSVKTDYEYIELGLITPPAAPFVTESGLTIYPICDRAVFTVYFPSDSTTDPNTNPHPEPHFLENRIRQFDEWKSSLEPNNIALRDSYRITGDWPERPEPFSFEIDVPEQFLTRTAIAQARVRLADPLDNSPSDLKVPKHTELLPA